MGLGCQRARGEPKADISIAQQLYGESCTGPGTTLLFEVNEAGCVATCTLVNIVLFTHLWFAAASQGHSGLFFQVAFSQPPYAVSIYVSIRFHTSILSTCILVIENITRTRQHM